MTSQQVVNVRYIVQDVDAAIDFYTKYLGFKLEMHPVPGFAALSRGSFRLYVNQPGVGGGGQALPDGTMPQPGGWNRFQITTADLDAEVERLKTQGATCKTDIIDGQGGREMLLEDPSGNLIELFEFKKQ